MRSCCKEILLLRVSVCAGFAAGDLALLLAFDKSRRDSFAGFSLLNCWRARAHSCCMRRNSLRYLIERRHSIKTGKPMGNIAAVGGGASLRGVFPSRQWQQSHWHCHAAAWPFGLQSSTAPPAALAEAPAPALAVRRFASAAGCEAGQSRRRRRRAAVVVRKDTSCNWMLLRGPGRQTAYRTTRLLQLMLLMCGSLLNSLVGSCRRRQQHEWRGRAGWQHFRCEWLEHSRRMRGVEEAN